jgi:Resolvase, N terminal domain
LPHPVSYKVIDTTSTSGKLTFHIFAAPTKFERQLVRERTPAGLRAARALGLGSCLTTLHRRRKARIHAILGIPDHIESAAIIPLGWPDREYGPNRRPPLAQFVMYDRWTG